VLNGSVFPAGQVYGMLAGGSQKTKELGLTLNKSFSKKSKNLSKNLPCG
jgi:hypothetical protein